MAIALILNEVTIGILIMMFRERELFLRASSLSVEAKIQEEQLLVEENVSLQARLGSGRLRKSPRTSRTDCPIKCLIADQLNSCVDILDNFVAKGTPEVALRMELIDDKGRMMCAFEAGVRLHIDNFITFKATQNGLPLRQN